jgi:glutamate N-acetyltransferase / amino-acid N-acetyltransferase
LIPDSLPYYNSLMEKYSSASEYEKDLEGRGALPRGFRTSSRRFQFHPAELPGDLLYPMDLTLIELPDGTDAAAGIFTRNAFPGAPVILCRERIDGTGIRGILVNNKVANVCVSGGLADAKRVTSELARLTETGGQQWLYASTGVIGWKIPADGIAAELPGLLSGLQGVTALPAARGIMTTDRYPKLRSADIGGARIVGIAKGAGMIEPDMATMLTFILTDVDLPRDQLQRALVEAARDSFNAISVDGDQSTSDMALLLSSRRGEKVEYDAFLTALRQVCGDLARDIVRNGEGTSHLIEVRVRGASSDGEAKTLAKGVVNSPLVKTAVYGNDPNLGRIVSSLGDTAGSCNIEIRPEALSIRMGTRTIFSGGEFSLPPEAESELSAYMSENSFSSRQKGFPEHDGRVVIEIDLNSGNGSFRVWGSDLSYEYVRENAEYRS